MGVRYVEFGVETVDDVLLKWLQKPFSVKHLHRACSIARRLGIYVIPNLIIGMTSTQDSVEVRHAELGAELSSCLDTEVGVVGWREGFDYHADLASAPGQWTRVVLSPRIEVLKTSYEGSVDFGYVIQRQALAYAASRSAGVLVPTVHLARHRHESQHGRSLLLLDQIPDDESWSARSDYQLGGLVRQLHAVPGWTLDGGSVDQITWRDIVGDRLERRLSAAQRHLGLSDLPDVESILDVELSEIHERPLDRLLHMDIRRPNICVTNQRIGGLIDFANVIRGDPLFELARIRYSGLLSDNFLRGYGIEDPSIWSRRNASLLALYEMDVASLLVTVAAEEADDPDLFAHASARLHELLRIVRDATQASISMMPTRRSSHVETVDRIQVERNPPCP